MDYQIISYLEMCHREGVNLQRGMNYRLRDNHSVILMSLRVGAPYSDRIENDGTTLIYEGHDVPKTSINPYPKNCDQQLATSTGALTQNGLFWNAADKYKHHQNPPERIRVYEKIKQGIWSYNGVFHLIDAWIENSSERNVIKFKLVAVEDEENFAEPIPQKPIIRRIIPTSVKLAVWQRDNGKCVRCGSAEDLHFDHIIPWSKGGSSNTPDNIQLLCGKHNLQKHDKIE